MVSAFGDLNGSGNQQVWVYTALSSQDTVNNASTYYGEVRYYGNGWGTYTGAAQYWSANFGGHAVSGSWTIPYANRNDSYTVLWTGYYTRIHNADGTLGAFGVSASIDSNHASIGDGTASTTEPAAPTIPRASTPSFVGGAGLTTNVGVTINTNRASTGFTHDASWAFGTLTGQTAGFSASTGIGDNFTWTPPQSMLAQIPNATVGNGTLTLVTKSGSTVIGTKSISFTVTADNTVKPTVSSVTLDDQNATVVSQVGAYVQGLSVLRGTVNATGIHGSTISSISWSVNGQTANSGGDLTPTSSGTVAVGGAATDSRGRTGTSAQNITLLPYVVPKFNNVTVRRANAAGTLADEGTHLRLDLNAEVQSIINSTQRNSLTIKVFTRLYGTTTWTARNVINHGSVSYNTYVLVSGGAIFPVNQSFDVRVEINDKFNTSAAQTIVATAAIFMHWSSTGVGIGKYHTQGTLDVAGTIFATDMSVSGGYTPINVSDWNNVLKAGFYGSNNTAINGPFGFWWKGVVIQHGSEVIQLLHNNSNPGALWSRTYTGGNWSPWEFVGVGKADTWARDAIYGIPTTDAQRVALANRRVIFHNTDFGWDESYYAVTGLSGLSARGLVSGTQSGWYPIGYGPEMHMDATSPIYLAPGNGIGGWSTVKRNGGSSWFSSDGTTMSFPKAGFYHIEMWSNQQPGAGTAEYELRLVSSSDLNPIVQKAFTGYTLVSSLWTPMEGRVTLLIAAGQRVIGIVRSGTLYIHQNTGVVLRGQFIARYIGPALVSD